MKDNVHIGNATTTLGEYLIEYNENLLIEASKNATSYLISFSLSQNCINDVSNGPRMMIKTLLKLPIN